MRRVFSAAALITIMLSVFLFPVGAGHGEGGGSAPFGAFEEKDFERPETCRQCHIDIYEQWSQAMMSEAFTHHWDEIEYFDLAVEHAKRNPEFEDAVAGCNGCHTPLMWLTGTKTPPRPAEGSRANESVSCDICHTITARTGDPSVNFNYVNSPGKTKYGNREGVVSPYHETAKLDFVSSAEYCGICHNEQNPFGLWVKSTQLEWAEGPYNAEGVQCHTCHMPRGPGRSANTAKEAHPDVAQHLFHGAHDPGKVGGSIEMRMHPVERELEPGDQVVIKVQLFNGKCGHKVPSGSAEERQLWLRVTAVDATGREYHLPVDLKGFEGEEQTITSNELTYQDMGYMLGRPDFKGIPRDALPEGDRIFCLPYFDPEGRRTIAQWNTATFGTDYRIGPRETKIETYTWTLPNDIEPGKVIIKGTLNYRRLVKSVAEYLKVPEDETEIIHVNDAETWFEVFD
ncbi:MAG: NapC/NirT family cytochrome c [Candidatus Krumholzibacteria bacterium]|nr:NapC/NirT family cytochrome c [Candidatus Krumholzibacteria bacterium]